MKKLTLLAFVFSAALSVTAQTYPDTFIKGVLNIEFNTRYAEKPVEGTTDNYSFSVNVSNSAKFAGTIKQLPTIPGTLYGVKQAGCLTFDLKTDVVNPKNPEQTRNVGKIFGVVPVSPSNVYDFNNGTLKTQVFAIGAAKAFESKFSGLALGKPPTPSDGVLSSLKKAAINFTKSVHGQNMSIAVTKYDVMQFQQHVLAAGPVQIYGDVTVNGTMLYDYDRSSWYFQHVSVQYWDNGRQVQDNLSGDIRWVEDDNRKTNGLGEYDFDVRINEPPPNESAVFSKPSDESAFFDTDNTIQGLTGTMKYKDTMTSDGNVTASAVNIDLKGNKLTKQQAMYLCKLILFSTVVPLNAE
ncbi:MAG: hypothetical protein ABSE59_08115 [Opitutaceae bacterium]